MTRKERIKYIWLQGNYPSYAKLAEELGVSREYVRQACHTLGPRRHKWEEVVQRFCRICGKELAAPHRTKTGLCWPCAMAMRRKPRRRLVTCAMCGKKRLVDRSLFYNWPKRSRLCRSCAHKKKNAK